MKYNRKLFHRRLTIGKPILEEQRKPLNTFMKDFTIGWTDIEKHETTNTFMG
ncbi:MAG: hypothetical protein FWC33_00275 [Candidatus Bathyarchaeota archaeon]|nr:hypothetical protein [Candidatus Termiticorpusculum sp.]